MGPPSSKHVLCWSLELPEIRDFGSHSFKIYLENWFSQKNVKPINIFCVTVQFNGEFFRGVNFEIWPQFEEPQPEGAEKCYSRDV